MTPRSAMFARKVAAASRAARAAASGASRVGSRGGDLSFQRSAGQDTWFGLSKPSGPLFLWQGQGPSILPPSIRVPREVHSSGNTFTDQQPKKVFELKKEDLESDEALWALYERWCRHFGVQRDHAEMSRRFDRFKTYMQQLHAVNSSDLDIRLAINEYADEFVLDEMLDPQFYMRLVAWYEARKEKKRSGPSKGVFEVKEEDLRSDEALWSLYERWCQHFKVQRDRDEMTHCFRTFKTSVNQVHAVNTSDEIPMLLELNKLADERFVPDDEVMEYISPYIQRRVINQLMRRSGRRQQRLLLKYCERFNK